MRRAVPFRLEEARFNQQVFAGEGREVTVLVVLVRQALVERLRARRSRRSADASGRSTCATPNLLNLCRDGDRRGVARRLGRRTVQLHAGRYFSLVILRAGRLIFFRCKTLGEDRPAAGRTAS